MALLSHSRSSREKKKTKTKMSKTTHIGVNDSHSIHRGIVSKVDTSTGTCEVICDSGASYSDVRMLQSGSKGLGAGLMMMPRSDTRCIIVVFKPVSLGAYIIGTFEEASENQTSNWKSPSDFFYGMGSGMGHVHFSQTGFVDIMADPWVRISLLPREQQLKVVAKHFGMEMSPISSLNIVQDDRENQSFVEFMHSSEYLEREDPDFRFVLGSSDKSAKANPFNPQLQGIKLFFDLIGGNRDNPDYSLYHTVGDHEDGYLVLSVMQHGDFVVEARKGLGSDKGLLSLVAKKDSIEVFSLILGQDGSLTFKNKGWSISIEEESKAQITNGETSLTVEGDQIFLATDASSTEPLPLGNKLESLLNDILNYIKSHNHLHPQGPTTGLVAPPIIDVDILSSKNHID